MNNPSKSNGDQGICWHGFFFVCLSFPRVSVDFCHCCCSQVFPWKTKGRKSSVSTLLWLMEILQRPKNRLPGIVEIHIFERWRDSRFCAVIRIHQIVRFWLQLRSRKTKNTVTLCDVPSWNRTTGLIPRISIRGPPTILHFSPETFTVNPLFCHLTWGPLSPRISRNKAHLILHWALTTWARARHRVCSITQVFRATDGGAMVPLFPVRLSSLSSLGWNPPRSCRSSTPLSPGRHN